MSDPIGEVKGVGPELKAKLAAAGITNTQQFLEHAHTAKQRSDLASKVGATHVELKEIANRADLMRVNGIGGVYSNLLEEAGVNSCKELQHRKPENLEVTLQEVHAKRKLVQHLPTLAQITEWVTEAKKLAATSPEN
jgi:predicted flap endonuclease-1-like 5' DNA nuclease